MLELDPEGGVIRFAGHIQATVRGPHRVLILLAQAGFTVHAKATR
jgi:hypothetical protein